MGKDGELRDYICYESLREFPASGGPTCLCRTFESQVLVDYAVKLLKSIGFTGMAMLDFRGSAEAPKLLEINPRVWGSANLCDVADSSYFVSYVRAAAGEDSLLSPSLAPLYNTNAAMRFSPQNAASFISYVKNGKPLFKTAGEYIKTAFDSSIQDGFNRKGDRKPYYRYIKNLIERS
jgi:carbamoylphosphate synthase large subunit